MSELEVDLAAANEENADLRGRLHMMEEAADKAYIVKTERAQLLDAASGDVSGDREHVLGAYAVTDPATTGALAIRQLLDGSLSGVGMDIGTIAAALRAQAKGIADGDTRAIKELLSTQAALADLLAKDCIKQAANAEETLTRAGTARPVPEAIEGHRGRMLELSLKAMGQTQKAAQAIASLEAGPRSHTFIHTKQANLAGQQVIQNGQPVEVLAGKVDNPDNDSQLLENRPNANWSETGIVDPGEKVAAVRTDSELGTVEAQHRPGDGSRKT